LIDKGHENRQRFNWENAASRTLAAYEQAIGKKPETEILRRPKSRLMVRSGGPDDGDHARLRAITAIRYSAVGENARRFSVSQVVRRISRMAILLVAARMLGAGTFGAYALLLTVVEMVAIVSGYGYVDFLTREVARHREAALDLGVRMTLIRLAYILPSLGLAVLALATLRFPAATILNVALLAVTLLPRAAGESAQGILRGFQRFSPLPWMELTQGVTVLTAAVVLVGMGFGLRGVIAGELLGALAGSIIAISSVAGLVSFNGATAPGLSALARQTFAFNVYPFITNVYDRVDIILLARLAGNVATGIYSLPYRAFGLLQIIPSSVMGALLPVFSAAGLDQDARERCRTVMKFLYLTGLLITLATLAFAAPVVLFILGPSYSGSATVLEILVWAGVPTFLNLALNTLLLAAHREKVFLWTATVCTVFNIAANLLLIPKFSFKAAAWVTVATECLLLAQNLYLVRKLLGHSVLPKDWAGITIAFTAVMAGFWGLQRGIPQTWAGTAALAVFAIFAVWSAAELRQLHGPAEGEPAK